VGSEPTSKLDRAQDAVAEASPSTPSTSCRPPTKMLATVRRKETTRRYHRRGRSGDPEYAVKGLPMRNKEDLTPTAAAKLWNTLLEAGATGEPILAAYIAKEKIRDVLALSPTRTALTQPRGR